MVTHMCPCGTTTESRTYIVGECKMREEERDALEEMSKSDVYVTWKSLVDYRVEIKRSLS